MFDGLIAVLMDWVAEVWCWLLTKAVELAAFLLQLVTALMPDIAVPGWFSLGFGEIPLSMIAWVFPTGVLSWCIGGWVAVELVMIVIIPLYRALMDLL